MGISEHPADHAAPLYEGIEKQVEPYPRIYVKDHPWIDYYQETPNGTYFTTKTPMKFITLASVITKEGATFSEILENVSCENQQPVG